MLKELRHALADTINAHVPEARVFAHPPLRVNMPGSGVFCYVQPADEYVSPWMTMSFAGGRAQVRLEVVFLVSDTTNAERDVDRVDDLIDPLSDAPNVFGALKESPTLGISDFEVNATMVDSVSGWRRVPLGDAESNAVAYELVLPVQVIVQRS